MGCGVSKGKEGNVAAPTTTKIVTKAESQATLAQAYQAYMQTFPTSLRNWAWQPLMDLCSRRDISANDAATMYALNALAR
jgi:hypothetical protein